MSVELKTGFLLLLFLTVITGVIYPLLITTIAQSFFPWQANGSLLTINKQTIGSLLIGQSFNGENYFWGRPSATLDFPYNALRSSGSNLGPSNPQLILKIKERIAKAGVKIAMGVGGAFDLMSGAKKRAPQFARDIGLEWLWRLVQEPSRWRRMVRAVFIFPWLVVRQ